MRRGVHRTAAWCAVAAMVATACGTQLSDEEIAAYAGNARAVSADVEGSVSGPGTDGAATPTDGGTGSAAPGAGGGAGTGGEGTGTGDGSGSGTTTGGTGTDTGGGTDAGADGDTGGGGDDAGGGDAGGGDAGGDDGGGQAPTDTRAAPAGGNGGATDVGVTETSIRIVNVVDRTGAIPGLFQDAQEAVAAYFLKFASEEGTVYGRSIELVQQDAKLSNQGNRAAYLDACGSAFAAVGSMSAFEQGAAGPVAECGIPDVRTAAVSPEVMTLDSVVSIDAMRPGVIPLSEWEYGAQTYPDAITRAGYLWVDNATTTFQTSQNRRATEAALGYDWIAEIPIALSEVNYASIIQQLKDAGVRYVAYQGDATGAARLASTMQQQGYTPDVFALQSNVYSRTLIETCGATCEELNVQVAQTGALVEEIDGNPEMQSYAEWLARVNPRAQPTGLGLYAWGAAKAFVEALKEMGPEVTRAGLLEALRTRTEYTADGLIPPQNLRSQDPTDCIIILNIEGGQFVRAAPSEGYRCRSGPLGQA